MICNLLLCWTLSNRDWSMLKLVVLEDRSVLTILVSRHWQFLSWLRGGRGWNFDNP